MNRTYKSAVMFKLSLLAGLLTVAAWLAFMPVEAQEYVQQPKHKEFVYNLTGEAWLTVRRVNNAYESDWHPSFTLVTSTYKPVVTKHGNTYEITFRSPNLPSPDLP